MKSKNLIINIGVLIGFILMIVGICLSIWLSCYSSQMESLNTANGIGIFEDKSQLNCGWLGIICEIALVISLVLVASYIVLFTLQVCGVGKLPYTRLLNILSYIVLALAVVAIVSGVLYAVWATAEVPLKGVYLTPGVGFYLFISGAIVSGGLGLYINR